MPQDTLTVLAPDLVQLNDALAALTKRLQEHFSRKTESRRSPDSRSAVAFIVDAERDNYGLGVGARLTPGGTLEYKVTIAAEIHTGDDWGTKSRRDGYAFFVCASEEEAWAKMLANLKADVY